MPKWSRALPTSARHFSAPSPMQRCPPAGAACRGPRCCSAPHPDSRSCGCPGGFARSCSGSGSGCPGRAFGSLPWCTRSGWQTPSPAPAPAAAAAGTSARHTPCRTPLRMRRAPAHRPGWAAGYQTRRARTHPARRAQTSPAPPCASMYPRPPSARTQSAGPPRCAHSCTARPCTHSFRADAPRPPPPCPGRCRSPGCGSSG